MKMNVLLGVTVALGLSGCAHRFAADLTGSQEVPPVATTATARAIFHLTKDGKAMRYKIMVDDLTNVTMAHLRLGRRRLLLR